MVNTLEKCIYIYICIEDGIFLIYQRANFELNCSKFELLITSGRGKDIWTFNKPASIEQFETDGKLKKRREKLSFGTQTSSRLGNKPLGNPRPTRDILKFFGVSMNYSTRER